MLMRLTLALTMLAPTPTQKEADAAFHAQEYRRALDLFLARAADPNVHPPDALRGVHDSLIELHRQTQKAEHLCRALKVVRKQLASGTFADAGERAAWVALEAKDVARVERAGVDCTAPKKTRAEKPVVDRNAAASTPATVSTPAASTAAPTPVEEPTLEPPAALAATAASEAPEVRLLPVMGRAPTARASGADMRAAEAPASTPSATPPRWPGDAETRKTNAPRGRGLVIAGGATLVAGIGLTAAGVVMSGPMREVRREVHALREEVGPVGTEEQAARDASLSRDYERQRALVLTTTIVGASAIVVGAALIGVGAKRLARASSRAALLPTPGGLVLRARF